MMTNRSSVLVAFTAVLLMLNANILTTNGCLVWTKQHAREHINNLLSMFPDIAPPNGYSPYGNQPGFGQQGLNQLRPNNGFNNGIQPQQQLPNGQQQLLNGQQGLNPYGNQQGFGQQPNYNGQQPNYNGQQPNYNGQQQQQLPYNQLNG